MSAPWPTHPAAADPLTAGQWRVAAAFEQALLAAPEAAALRRVPADDPDYGRAVPCPRCGGQGDPPIGALISRRSQR